MQNTDEVQRLIAVMKGDIKWPGATDTYNAKRAKLYMSQHKDASIEDAAKAVLADEPKGRLPTLDGGTTQ
jgi:hypothetical protein